MDAFVSLFPTSLGVKAEEKKEKINVELLIKSALVMKSIIVWFLFINICAVQDLI